ncbi:hypothetical protein L249_1785 [Ophiocordyceps polyrhachis-furcata BCC 54312]|uniref:Uncharacterized protein n=1 Tax=Ophiocordyceps polyrhachis-furcata BCC 54312 TaxID=1330021 RepID=A0A367LPD6_9HYPO|nr:hypothetical protein L249_1785 [Ophiocordyceps polyrhachis-furcata BCC 54312]
MNRGYNPWLWGRLIWDGGLDFGNLEACRHNRRCTMQVSLDGTTFAYTRPRSPAIGPRSYGYEELGSVICSGPATLPVSDKRQCFFFPIEATTGADNVRRVWICNHELDGKQRVP